jgi:hypothetical protein
MNYPTSTINPITGSSTEHHNNPPDIRDASSSTDKVFQDMDSAELLAEFRRFSDTTRRQLDHLQKNQEAMFGARSKENWAQRSIRSIEETRFVAGWVIPTAKVVGTGVVAYQTGKYAWKAGKVVVGFFRGGAAEATVVAATEVGK